MNTLPIPQPNKFIITNSCKTESVTASEMKVTASPNFENWEIDNLIDYVVATHHSYVKKNTVVIYSLANEVAYQHAHRHPELLKLTEVAFLYFHDLLNNIKIEEQILFPKAKQLLNLKIEKQIFSPQTKQLFKGGYYKDTSSHTSLGEISDTVSLLQRKQLAAYGDLRRFRKLTNNYQLPEDACNSYKFLFRKMKEFENDLVVHSNFGNKILFPKVIALEKEMAYSANSIA